MMSSNAASHMTTSWGLQDKGGSCGCHVCLSICVSKAKGIRVPQLVPFPARAGGGWIGMIKEGGKSPLAGVLRSLIVQCMSRL